MSSKKKITFAISTLTGGGAEGICINIANAFARSGWRVDLVVLNLKDEVYIDRISKDVNLIVLHVNNARYSIFPLMKYLYLKKPKTFLVFNHELAVVLVALRFILRLNIKIIARNISIFSYKIDEIKKKGFWGRFILLPLIKYFFKKVDHVINQSQNMQEDLVKLYPNLDSCSSIIYNPISTYIGEYINKNNLTKIKKKNYLLCVGRLEPVKAIHYAIEGFAGIANQFPNLRLKIVGKGILEGELKQKAIDFSISNKVDFEGFQKDIIPYYLYAKATILTSQYEGYPNVLLESIAMNTPVVAFDCPGGTSEIVKNGFNGYLVNNKDIDDLKNKLANIMLKDLNNNYLKNSIKDNQIDQVFKNYEKLLNLFI